MDIEMKVQILRACSSKKGNRCSSCPAFGHGNRNCIRNAMKDAATALSTLKAENEKLREKIVGEDDGWYGRFLRELVKRKEAQP